MGARDRGRQGERERDRERGQRERGQRGINREREGEREQEREGGGIEERGRKREETRRAEQTDRQTDRHTHTHTHRHTHKHTHTHTHRERYFLPFARFMNVGVIAPSSHQGLGALIFQSWSTRGRTRCEPTQLKVKALPQLSPTQTPLCGQEARGLRRAKGAALSSVRRCANSGEVLQTAGSFSKQPATLETQTQT